MSGAASGASSLDVLEAEDRRILATLEELGHHRGQAVTERARYGDMVKLLLRQLAAREAAAVDVSEALRHAPSLEGVAERMERDAPERRRHLDRIERMTRGVKGLDLNTGQDVDTELRRLTAVITPGLTWELGSAIPEIRATVPAAEAERLFATARRVRRHAPTNLNPRGSRWWERAPVVSRLLTIFDHLRDFPSAAKRPN